MQLLQHYVYDNIINTISVEKAKELNEELVNTLIDAFAENVDDPSQTSALIAFARDMKPETEESKDKMGKQVTSVVENTVPVNVVRRRANVEEIGDESRKRRRRATEEETEESNDDDDDDETGMSVDEASLITHINVCVYVSFPKYNQKLLEPLLKCQEHHCRFMVVTLIWPPLPCIVGALSSQSFQIRDFISGIMSSVNLTLKY